MKGKKAKKVGEAQRLSPHPPGGATRGPGGKPSTGWPYPLELRRQAVRLHLEEGYTVRMVAGQMGIAQDTLWNWVRRYQQHGEAGPRPKLLPHFLPFWSQMRLGATNYNSRSGPPERVFLPLGGGRGWNTFSDRTSIERTTDQDISRDYQGLFAELDVHNLFPAGCRATTYQNNDYDIILIVAGIDRTMNIQLNRETILIVEAGIRTTVNTHGPAAGNSSALFIAGVENQVHGVPNQGRGKVTVAGHHDFDIGSVSQFEKIEIL